MHRVVTGDFARAQQLLTHSVQTTEHVYGARSIELANELRKYAEVCTRAELFAQALGAADRASAIFALNYGADCEQVRELDELKNGLKGRTGQGK